jgi:riboflavin synthase
MFTGLVETIGVVRRIGGAGERTARAQIVASLGALELGESINVDGVCLTVDRILPDGFEADLSSETLAVSTLATLTPGARVHLERAVPLGGRMGGHTVLGHVDGVGEVRSMQPIGASVCLTVSAPGDLARYLAPKGSIAISGVSLTLNRVGVSRGPHGARSRAPAKQKRVADVVFEVMLVPHTLARTALGTFVAGSKVNIEVDVLARYVARQLESGVASPGSSRDNPATRNARGGAPILEPHGDGGRGEVDESGSGHDERILAKLRASGYT